MALVLAPSVPVGDSQDTARTAGRSGCGPGTAGVARGCWTPANLPGRFVQYAARDEPDSVSCSPVRAAANSVLVTGRENIG